MLAIVEAYRAGLLKKEYWLPNIMAGIIVGIVALPLSMAFAIASGVTPAQGLYTAVVAGFIVGIFGGSRVQIAGPTGAFIVILAGITAKYGVDGLQVATLLAGVILALMGLLKLGNVIKFIPDPVIVGFTTGIGVIIFINEWKDFFGLHVTLALDARFYQKFFILIQQLPKLDVTTTGLACLSLALMLIVPKFIKRVPGTLVALVVGTLLQTIYHFKGVATLGSTFGGIPQQLPHFQIPTINLPRLLELIGPAFTVALLGAIESLLSATAADGMANTRHDSNQELIGQGLANIVAPLFGGFAATGAIARTATNIRNGGNSPISSIVHAGFLVLVIVLLAPLAVNVPLCTLAAILFVVAFNMSDLPHFSHIVRSAPRHDVIVMLATFGLTVLTDLVIAVNVGVILAMLLFIHRMHQSVLIEELSHDKIHDELKHVGIPVLTKDILVYTIQGPFFFGVAEKIERALSLTNADPKKVVIRLKDVPFMDITGLQTLQEIVEQYHKRHINVYLCEANHRVLQKLQAIGVLKWLVGHKVFPTFAEAIKH